jgi:R.HinP1I restriction endonuclease
LEVHSTGNNLKKSDVLLGFTNNFFVGVNIKAGKVGFNQITRLWLEKFKTEIALNEESVDIIQNGIDNHRLKRSKILIEPDFQVKIKHALEQKSKLILELIFKGIGNDIVKVLVIYNRNNKVFYFYDVDEIIENISKTGISFSKNGVVRFGEFITLQRKGGNGDKLHLPKSDSRHPGNQLQFKMKIIDFVNSTTPFFTFS